MKIFQIKAYDFKELSEASKRKAVDEYRKNEFAWTDEDGNELNFTFEEKLHDYGFEDGTSIDFSLRNQQGDGVAFYGSIDASHWLKNHIDSFTEEEMKKLLNINEEYEIDMGTITNSLSNHYSHAYTMTCYINIDNEVDEDELIRKLNNIFEKEIRKMSRELEKLGYKTIEEKEKDETIISDLENSSFLFNEDGTFLNIDERYFYVR